MARKEPRELKVIGSKRLTANMHRVTLGGEGMRDFPEDHEVGYIKFRFPHADGDRPISRAYSVRFQRENEIDVDFASHGDGDRRHAGQLLVRMVRPLWQEAPAPKP